MLIRLSFVVTANRQDAVDAIEWLVLLKVTVKRTRLGNSKKGDLGPDTSLSSYCHEP